MSGVLYIVATPIGNLDDITLRAIEILRNVDLIAAEDTRHSQRLLGHLGIRKPMVSMHQHNENNRYQQLIDKMLAGMDIALISDAGTPLLSDPGFPLVRAARSSGITVSPIPGASSVIAALSAAGLPLEPFTFLGFLSHKNRERIRSLESYKSLHGTLVLLESSHRIERLMQQLNEIMPDKQLVVAKELTKTHENFLCGKAEAIIEMLTDDRGLCKGEFVVLIDNPPDIDECAGEQDVIDMLKVLLRELPLKQAVKIASQLNGRKRNELYEIALRLNQAASDNTPE
jgi:16S rRNA (cytidine1402-2'-O)-methyltransferase